MRIQKSFSSRILYIRTQAEAIALRYASQLLAAITILIGISVCSLRIPARESTVSATNPWRIVTLESMQNQAAQPLHPPVLLDDALIWRKPGDSALTYTRLDASAEYRLDWLRGIPVQWSALESNDQIFLIWRTISQDLWVALLSSEGEQMTAPVEMARESVTDFHAALLNRNALVVAWLEGDSLQIRAVDASGRPHPTIMLQDNVKQFAFTASRDAFIAVWQTGDSLFTAPVTFNSDLLVIPDDNTQTLASFILPPDAWLARLEILQNTEQYPVILLGLYTAAPPPSAK